MDEYLHVSIHNMHAGNTGNPDRREKERRQQHYSDQARIAELKAMLAEAADAFAGAFENDDAVDGGDCVEWLAEYRDRVKAVLAKG